MSSAKPSTKRLMPAHVRVVAMLYGATHAWDVVRGGGRADVTYLYIMNSNPIGTGWIGRWTEKNGFEFEDEPRLVLHRHKESGWYALLDPD